MYYVLIFTVILISFKCWQNRIDFKSGAYKVQKYSEAKSTIKEAEIMKSRRAKRLKIKKQFKHQSTFGTYLFNVISKEVTQRGIL